MDKSATSSQSQKPSAGRRERIIHTTPHSETMTPPTPKSMASPTTGTSRPAETSDGSMSLKILEDVMGRLKPTGKMSEVFSQLAKKFKDEEEQRTSVPIGITIGASVHTDTGEFKEAVESGEIGKGRQEEENKEVMEEDAQRLAEEESEDRSLEVVDIGEEGSSDDGETLDERTKRRNLRMAKKAKMVEVDDKLVESATRAVEEYPIKEQRPEPEETRTLREEAALLATAKREAAERKRKGKQVATPSKNKKHLPASLGVVIRETSTNPTKTSRHQEEEQFVGAFGRQEIDLDEKVLEDMIKFEDPKLRKSCAGRVSKSRPAQSGRKIHLPSLCLVRAKKRFLD